MRTRKNNSRWLAAPLAAAPRLVLLALGCCAAQPAAAGDKHPADVTISVVEDPEQLKEKVNTIRLPDADDADQAARKPGQQPDSDRRSRDAGELQHNETPERHQDVDDKTQSPAEAAHAAAGEALQHSADAPSTEPNL